MNFNENSTNPNQKNNPNRNNNIKIEIYDDNLCIIKFNNYEAVSPSFQNYDNHQILNKMPIRNLNFKSSGSLIFSKSECNFNISPESIRNSKVSLLHYKANSNKELNLPNVHNNNNYNNNLFNSNTSNKTYIYNNHSVILNSKCHSKLSETIINIKNSNIFNTLSDDTFDLSRDFSSERNQTLSISKGSKSLLKKNEKFKRRNNSETIFYLGNRIEMNQVSGSNFDLIKSHIRSENSQKAKLNSDKIASKSDKNCIPKENNVQRALNFTNSNNSMITVSTNNLNFINSKRRSNLRRNNYSEISDLSQFNASEKYNENSILTNSLSISKSTINLKKYSNNNVTIVNQLPNSASKNYISNKSIFYSPSTICNYYQHSNEVTPSVGNSIKRIKKNVNTDIISKRDLTKEITDCSANNNILANEQFKLKRNLNKENIENDNYFNGKFISQPEEKIQGKPFNGNNFLKNLNVLVNKDILIKDYEDQQNIENRNRSEIFEENINMNSVKDLHELHSLNNETNSLNFSLSKNSISKSINNNNFNKINERNIDENISNNNFNIINIINGLNTTKKTPIRTIKYNKDQLKSGEKNSLISSDKKDSNFKYSLNYDNFNINYEIFKSELNAFENNNSAKNRETKDDNFTLNTINNYLISLSKIQSNLTNDDFGNLTTSRLSPTKELNNIFENIDINDNQLIKVIDNDKNNPNIDENANHKKAIENLIFEDDKFKEAKENSENILVKDLRFNFNLNSDSLKENESNIINKNDKKSNKRSYERGKINVKLNFDTSNDFKMEEIFNTKYNTCTNKCKKSHLNPNNPTNKYSKLSKSNEKKNIEINKNEPTSCYKTEDSLNQNNMVYKFNNEGLIKDKPFKTLSENSNLNNNSQTLNSNRKSNDNQSQKASCNYIKNNQNSNNDENNIINDLDEEQELGRQLTTNKLLDSCSDKKNRQLIYLFNNKIENLNSLISDENTINNSHSINICNESVSNNNNKTKNFNYENNIEGSYTSNYKEKTFNTLNKYINVVNENKSIDGNPEQAYLDKDNQVKFNPKKKENENKFKCSSLKINKDNLDSNQINQKNLEVSEKEKKMNNLYLSISELLFENSKNVESLQKLLELKNGNTNEIYSDQQIILNQIKGMNKLESPKFDVNMVLNCDKKDNQSEIFDPKPKINLDKMNDSFNGFNKTFSYKNNDLDKNNFYIFANSDKFSGKYNDNQEENFQHEFKFKTLSNLNKKMNLCIDTGESDAVFIDNQNHNRNFSLGCNPNSKQIKNNRLIGNNNNNDYNQHKIENLNKSERNCESLYNKLFKANSENLNNPNKKIIFKRSKSPVHRENIFNCTEEQINIIAQKENKSIMSTNSFFNKESKSQSYFKNDLEDFNAKIDNILLNKNVFEDVIERRNYRKYINNKNNNQDNFSGDNSYNQSIISENKNSSKNKIIYSVDRKKINSAVSTKDTKSAVDYKNKDYLELNKKPFNLFSDKVENEKLNEIALNQKIGKVNIFDKIFCEEEKEVSDTKSQNELKIIKNQKNRNENSTSIKNDDGKFCDLDDIDQEEFRNNYYVVLKENKKLREKRIKEKKRLKNMNILKLYSKGMITNVSKLKEVSNNKNSKKITFDFLFSKTKNIDDNKKDIFKKLKNKSRSCTNIEELFSNKNNMINDLNALNNNNNYNVPNSDCDIFTDKIKNYNNRNEDNSNQKKLKFSNTQSKTIEILYECELERNFSNNNNNEKEALNKELRLFREYYFIGKSNSKGTKINREIKNQADNHNYSSSKFLPFTNDKFSLIHQNKSVLTRKSAMKRALNIEEINFKNQFLKSFMQNVSSSKKKNKASALLNKTRNSNQTNPMPRRLIRNTNRKFANRIVFDGSLQNNKYKRSNSNNSKNHFSQIFNQYQKMPFSSFILNENNKSNQVKTTSYLAKNNDHKQCSDSNTLTTKTIERSIFNAKNFLLKNDKNVSFMVISPLVKNNINDRSQYSENFINVFLLENVGKRENKSIFDYKENNNENPIINIKKKDIFKKDYDDLIKESIQNKNNQDDLYRKLVNNECLFDKNKSKLDDKTKKIHKNIHSDITNKNNFQNVNLNTMKFNDSLSILDDNRNKINNFNNYHKRINKLLVNKVNGNPLENIEAEENNANINELVHLNTFDSLATEESYINFNGNNIINEAYSNKNNIFDVNNHIYSKDLFNNLKGISANAPYIQITDEIESYDKDDNGGLNKILNQDKKSNFRFGNCIKLQVLDGDNDDIFDDFNS